MGLFGYPLPLRSGCGQLRSSIAAPPNKAAADFGNARDLNYAMIENTKCDPRVGQEHFARDVMPLLLTTAWLIRCQQSWHDKPTNVCSPEMPVFGDNPQTHASLIARPFPAYKLVRGKHGERLSGA